MVFRALVMLKLKDKRRKKDFKVRKKKKKELKIFQCQFEINPQ